MSDDGGYFDAYSPCLAADIIITAVAAIPRVYAIQASCFVLHSTGIVTQKGINKLGTGQSFVFNSPGGGNAKIFGPDGRQLTENLPITEKGMVFACL
jgi:nitrilase